MAAGAHRVLQGTTGSSGSRGFAEFRANPGMLRHARRPTRLPSCRMGKEPSGKGRNGRTSIPFITTCCCSQARIAESHCPLTFCADQGRPYHNPHRRHAQPPKPTPARANHSGLCPRRGRPTTTCPGPFGRPSIRDRKTLPVYRIRQPKPRSVAPRAKLASGAAAPWRSTANPNRAARKPEFNHALRPRSYQPPHSESCPAHGLTAQRRRPAEPRMRPFSARSNLPYLLACRVERRPGPRRGGASHSVPPAWLYIRTLVALGAETVVLSV